MSNKQKSLQTSSKKQSVEVFKREDDIKLSIGIAISMCGEELSKERVLGTLEAIKSIEFVLRDEHVLSAIKCGYSAKYGIPFKFTPMVVCDWIRKYMDSKPTPIDVDDMFYMSRGITIEEYCEKQNEKQIQNFLSNEGTRDRVMAQGQLEYNKSLYLPKNVREAQDKIFEEMYKSK